MAVLQSGQLSLEFYYTGFVYGWVECQFYFKWNGEPVFRDELLDRNGDYWSSREKYALLANQHDEDSLIPFLRHVLKTDQPDYWKPLEPKIVVALYPDLYFPFLPSHYQLIYESEEFKREKQDREALKQQQGQLPDDRFTFVASVDAYNFRDAPHYYGQGFCLHMIVTRQEIEAFISELEKEYEQFKLKFNVDDIDEP